MEKKKIGLLGAILMGIGCIVGSGIFGTLPTVANEYGAGVVWALIGAAAVVVLRALASTYSSAALPASGSQFLWAAKLMHPIAGAFVSFSTLLMPTMVSLFGVLFGMYLQPLFPNTEINGTVAAVALLVVFAVVAWFGNKTTINTGNVMVVLLLIAIALYIFLGLPHIDTANVTFGQIVRPGVSISTLAAAVGVLTSSLSGASSVAQVADDVKNPGKTVPLALVLCPAIVAVIYILMAVVTIGVIPAAEVTSLSDVAAQFMSPALLTFFPEIALHITRPIRWDSDHVVLFDDETKEICKEIVRCGGLDGRVNIALDYFDASINRISAWTVGFRNVEKALLSALCTPHTVLKELQDTNQFTELMVRQEELKTLPFGEVWDEYCRRNGVPVDGAWFEEVKKYEQNVLSKRI